MAITDLCWLKKGVPEFALLEIAEAQHEIEI
jgi:hypothetical protein